MHPKISVIVPVYKAEKYLHRCVDSILAQTFTDFELILVNDGSPDNSGAICDEYAQKDCRVRVFHKENGGVSSARNLGLDNAKGEWITFIDSDDYVHIDYLKDLYALRDADLIVGSYQMEGTDTPINGTISNETFFRPQLKDVLLMYGETGNFRGAMCKMYKLEIINQNYIRYNEKMSASEDWLFALEYIKYVNKICTLDKPYYYYEQQNVDGLSKNVRNFDSYFYAMEQFYKKVNEVERFLSIEGLTPIFLDVVRIYIRRQVHYLYFNKIDSYCEKIKKIKRLLNNPYVILVLKDNTRCKSRKKFRIFDFIALNKFYRTLLFYIYIYRGEAY